MYTIITVECLYDNVAGEYYWQVSTRQANIVTPIITCQERRWAFKEARYVAKNFEARYGKGTVALRLPK